MSYHDYGFFLKERLWIILKHCLRHYTRIVFHNNPKLIIIPPSKSKNVPYKKVFLYLKTPETITINFYLTYTLAHSALYGNIQNLKKCLNDLLTFVRKDFDVQKGSKEYILNYAST